MKKKYIEPEIILQELDYRGVLMLSRTLDVYDQVEVVEGETDYVSEFEDLLAGESLLWDEEEE